MINREPLEAGRPNPELEKISGPQKVMLLFIAVTLIVLIGVLAFLPSVAAHYTAEASLVTLLLFHPVDLDMK